MSGGTSNYPEHLNPFKSRNGGIRRSFRDFTKKLGNVWKKKDTKENNDDTKGADITTQRATLNVTLRNKTRIEYPKTDIYPRSRFSERVGHTNTIPPGFKTEIETVNPFEEEKPNEKIETQINGNGDVSKINEKLEDDIKIVTANDNLGTKRRRRRKKRAPLPPGTLGNSLGVPDLHDSKWSISSYETDCSSYTNHSENEQDISVDCENLKDLHKITSDIQEYFNEIQEKVTDDDDTLVKTSTSEDGNKISVEVVDIIEKDVVQEYFNEVEKMENDDDDLKAFESTLVKTSTMEDVNKNVEEVIHEVSKVSLASPEDDLEEEALINDALESIDCKEAQINDIPNTTSENGCDSTLNDSGVMSEDFNYIDGNGNCEINYNEETSIYINNNNVEIDDDNKRNEDEFEVLEKVGLSCESLDNQNYDAITSPDHPVPKIRKHKLSRDALLNNLPE